MFRWHGVHGRGRSKERRLDEAMKPPGDGGRDFQTMRATGPSGALRDAEMRGIPTRLEFLRPAHGIANVVHVLATHALLTGWLWASWHALPLGVYVPLGVLACLVHQRAMSEWIHEGAHFNLVRNRRWNDALTNVLTCVWFGITVDDYRSTHFPHHSRDAFFVEDDGDTVFLDIGSRGEFWRAIVRDVAGFTFLDQYRRFKAGGRGRRAGSLAVTLAVHGSVLLILLWLGRVDAYVLYFATLALLYPLLNRLRVYGQHVAVDAEGRSHFPESAASRTIDAGFIDRVLITSPRLLYHHEHHRWPHLPYRALSGLCVPSGDGNSYARSRWAVLRAIYRGLPA
jgi:fatty acid desaturase